MRPQPIPAPYPEAPEATMNTRNAPSAPLPSDAARSGAEWARIVTAAQAARDSRPPTGVLSAVGPALQASEYAADLTARYNATEVSGPGASIDVGFHGPAATWTLARWEAHSGRIVG